MIKHALAARGLRPVAELAASRPCGERLRYLAGCRCIDCRAANSRYECLRAQARRNGDWNGIVSAAQARVHILKLGRCGLGRRAIAAASDVREQTIQLIRRRLKIHIRARTARRILDVTPDMISDHALVPARRLWKHIRRLQEEGFSKAELARKLGYGYARPVLQFNKSRVTARHDFDVARLYENLMA